MTNRRLRSRRPSGAHTTPIAPVRASRRHVAAIAATAVVALLLGGTAWSISRSGDPQRPSAQARAAAIAAEQRAARAMTRSSGLLRGSARRHPGSAGCGGGRRPADLGAAHSLRHPVRRTVGAGPTTDQRFCMIIADLPPPRSSASRSRRRPRCRRRSHCPPGIPRPTATVHGLGEQIDYTLLPGGVVVAVPAVRRFRRRHPGRGEPGRRRPATPPRATTDRIR